MVESSFRYDPKDYLCLPSLHEAIDTFDASNAQQVLNTEICELFDKHGTASIFGIALLHRHFDMSQNEVLVEHGAESTPWILPQDPDNFMNGRIVPRSWYFAAQSETLSDVLRPYEFAFEKHEESMHAASLDKNAPFISDLCEVLRRNKLDRLLGLVTICPDYFTSTAGIPSIIRCERTFGRANLVFELGPEALKDKEKRTSIWTFGRSSNANGGRETMLCISGCLCSRLD